MVELNIVDAIKKLEDKLDSLEKKVNEVLIDLSNERGKKIGVLSSVNFGRAIFGAFIIIVLYIYNNDKNNTNQKMRDSQSQYNVLYMRLEDKCNKMEDQFKSLHSNMEDNHLNIERLKLQLENLKSK